MASLLSSVETEFTTDFAVLQAHQEVYVYAPIHVDMPASGTFAGTCPGGLYASCGTKYAEVRFRAERWDTRPAFERGWEDIDELPFAEVAGAGPLELGGFDRSAVGLNIDGLGRARVLVYARGRHRYNYSEQTQREGLPPEEWLLQFFPDPDALDALAGDPRRLAGRAPFDHVPQDGWHAALREWSLTGWDGYLQRYSGYSAIAMALRIGKQPQGRADLARTACKWHGYEAWKREPPSDPLAFPLRLEANPGRPLLPREIDAAAATERALTDLAFLAGLQQVDVFGDLIQALVNLGLLTPLHRGGTELMVPNPSPGIVWDALDLSDSERKQVRQNIGRYNFNEVADDISNMLTWAPEHRLEVTPHALALRLAVRSSEVIGALDFLDAINAATNESLSQGWPGTSNAAEIADQPFMIATITHN